MRSLPALPAISPRQKRVALALGAIALATVVGLSCALGSAALLRLWPAWPYEWASAMTLKSISMVSPDEGWAVGNISGLPNSLLMHYARGQWTILPKPDDLQDRSEFANVAMVSASDGWALASMEIPIGDKYHSFRPGGVFLHYDGSAWKVASPVLPIAIGDDPSALVMLSSRDGWATCEAEAFHYDGTAWRDVTALSDQGWGAGPAISATGPSDVWIAGGPSGSILHFDGATWTQQRIALPLGQPLPGSLILSGLAMVSPEEGWAVGGIGNSSQGVILHYIDGRWQVQSIVDQYLDAVAMASPKEGWAVGGEGGTYRYASGQWSKATSGGNDTLYDVTALPNGDAWAVGLGGALIHYRAGTWQQETRVIWSRAARAEWK